MSRLSDLAKAEYDAFLMLCDHQNALADAKTVHAASAAYGEARRMLLAARKEES